MKKNFFVLDVNNQEYQKLIIDIVRKHIYGVLYYAS